MFSTLSAEALNPDHPAHEYFATREEHVVDVARNIRWRVPDGVDAEQVLRVGFAMMDGVQLRWLRKPGQDLNAMWAECEDVLSPPAAVGRLPLAPPVAGGIGTLGTPLREKSSSDWKNPDSKRSHNGINPSHRRNTDARKPLRGKNIQPLEESGHREESDITPRRATCPANRRTPAWPGRSRHTPQESDLW